MLNRDQNRAVTGPNPANWLGRVSRPVACQSVARVYHEAVGAVADGVYSPCTAAAW